MITLKVASETGEAPFELRAYRTSDGPVFTCSCPDGTARRACRHRIDILTAEPYDLPSHMWQAAEGIQDLFRGSQAEKTICQLIEWQRRRDEAEQRIRAVLADLGKGLAGG